MSTIIIIDDEETPRALLSAIATSAGHKVYTANNGSNIVDLVKTHKPSLVLLDVRMDGGDGFAALRKVRADPAIKDTPIVMVSSKSTSIDKTYANKQGANDYVTKPFTDDAIKAVLSKYAR